MQNKKQKIAAHVKDAQDAIVELEGLVMVVVEGRLVEAR